MTFADELDALGADCGAHLGDQAATVTVMAFELTGVLNAAKRTRNERATATFTTTLIDRAERDGRLDAGDASRRVRRRSVSFPVADNDTAHAFTLESTVTVGADVWKVASITTSLGGRMYDVDLETEA
jgi:hypothetical protein